MSGPGALAKEGTPRAFPRGSLGAKLAAVGLPFLLLGLITTAISLWVSSQLDGGAASVNEAGRMRMQAYRLAWSAARTEPPTVRRALVESLDQSLTLLERGDPQRPLVTPWDDTVRARYDAVQAAWQRLRPMHASAPDMTALDSATTSLVSSIDEFVSAIEHHLSRYTNILHLLQVGLLVAATIASGVLVVAGYHFVIEPVTNLRKAVARLQSGDLATRVEPRATDELGELAAGFNDMARQIQTSHTGLEQRVREKTSELQEKRERLQSLYDVSLMVAHASGLNELAEAFIDRVCTAARADAAALRWADVTRDQFVLIASHGLPDGMAHDEHCIVRGQCHCGAATPNTGARVIPIRPAHQGQRPPCARAGWAAVVLVPIQSQDRLIGELDLFFHEDVTLTEAEHALLGTLTSHLASGMENFRLRALEREAAIAEERAFLARELHDSIAQSLAFLNIQAQLMRKAVAENDRDRMASVLSEIELGLRESHGDVRELLVHFRTRTNVEDMEHALHTTLRKFEHQSGLASTLTVHDDGLPLAPDVQVQALHIVQEALSNVRKHAHASHVWVDVWKKPSWRIEVRDDGRGFAGGNDGVQAEMHVGLRIMKERAQRLGATFGITTSRERGTTVSLAMPDEGAPALAASLESAVTP